MSINVTQSSMPTIDEFTNEIKELWESKWLTNMGNKHKTFEAKLATYLGTPNIKLYANGHLALEGILAAMEFAPGSEVITSPFTFASTTHAIVRSGLIPVMCDICMDDYTMDATKIEALITDRTTAILPVHVYGNICNNGKINEIAAKYNLKIIYDAAHAFGVKCNETSVSNLGDASMFSFHATKVFNTVEGGMVAFNDKSLSTRLDELKNFGIHGPESVLYVGSNAKMSEFAAAMGICNLRHIDEEIVKRKKVYERYVGQLSGVNGISLNYYNAGITPNYAYFPVLFEGYKFSRDEVVERLASKEIFARKYFYPLTSDYECYADEPFYGSEKTPVAKYVAERVLTLPMYADLNIEDVDKICEIILGN